MNLHIIYTPFTGVGLHGGFRGDKWFKHRIEIFKNYTLKSLVNQSNRDFIHWLSFRPEEKGNVRVEELAEYLNKLKYRFIITFDGLMYHDDKFTNYTLKTKLRNLLMMLWDGWRRKQRISLRQVFKYTWENKNKSLSKRLERSLKSLIYEVGNDYEWVYMTRIDSDDMFQRDVVELIQAQEPDYKKALVFDKGYILNLKTREVADWNPPTNPPFHTIIFPSNIFFSPLEHIEYYGNFRSHEDVPNVFSAETLDHDSYMVITHEKQIGTAWQDTSLKKVHNKIKYGTINPFKGYMYTSGTGENISTHWKSKSNGTINSMIGQEHKEIEQILAEFGL